ncbi:hypothetical protein BH10PLA2_BH10PLA2_25130 [soil metagenome]
MADEETRMLSYLQRSEVRLSTMHRIGGIFLNGAGLLFVLPIFFRDTLIDVVNLARFQAASWAHYPLLALLVMTVAVPTLAMFSLVRDMVDFYFVGQPIAGPSDTSEESFNLRFGLSALSIPSSVELDNEQDPLKRKVIEEHRKDIAKLRLLIPFLQDETGQRKRQTAASRAIIPLSRRAICEDDPELSQLYGAFGLAGLVDRSLIEEVAWAEAAQVRHVLALRRLVLRYIKALLVLLWTIGVFLVCSKWVWVPPNPGVVHAAVGARVTVALSAGCFLWSAITPFVIQFPLRWIHSRTALPQGFDSAYRDKDLVSFELTVIVICVAAFAISSILLATAVSESFHWEWRPTAGIVAAAVVGTVNAAYWLFRIGRAMASARGVGVVSK